MTQAPTPRISRALAVTPVEFATLDFIQRYRLKNGTGPTYQEIADETGVTKVTAYERIGNLQNKGYVTSNRSRRSIALTTACYAADAEIIGAGIPATAQCFTCEEFSGAPYLVIGDWSEAADLSGRFHTREIRLDCPHCGRTSTSIQRRSIG